MNKNRKPGLSGIIRAKNESRFIGTCIDTVIDSLDELIVVYNDCTDNTEEILLNKVAQYGDKIKIYPYNHNVLYNNLSQEEYEYAVSLPEDSPRLFCTQSNYSLDHTSYQYAVKIDPDQIYFPEEVKKWRDICCGKYLPLSLRQKITAIFFKNWISLYRLLSIKSGKVCTYLMPDKLIKLCSKSYLTYAGHLLQKGKCAIAWSGINIFVEDSKIFIPYDYRNIHPPYNGEGDLLLFKISDETRFHRYLIPGDNTKVVEYFYNPTPMYFAGAMWFHLHANRDYCAKNVSEMKKENPGLFIKAEKFTDFNYTDSLKLMSHGIPTLFQKTLFLLVHKMSMPIIKENLNRLTPVILGIFNK